MGGVAHFVDVARADALLVVHKALARRMGLPQEVGDQGVHARGGEEDGGVVLGDQGFARDFDMALGNEELHIFSTQFVGRDHAAKCMSGLRMWSITPIRAFLVTCILNDCSFIIYCIYAGRRE